MEEIQWFYALSLSFVTSIVVCTSVYVKEIIKVMSIKKKVTKMTNLQLQIFMQTEMRGLRKDVNEQISELRKDINAIKNDITSLKISDVKINTKLALFIIFVSGLTSSLIVFLPKLFL